MGSQTTHGKSKTAVYRIWIAMRQRCKTHVHYIENNITVCARWEKSFENFYADMGDPPKKPKHSLDRRDNTKGYCKSNCRWATKLVQNNNTSRNIRPGSPSLRQACIKRGLSPDTFYARVRRGLTPEQALAMDKYTRVTHTTRSIQNMITPKSRRTVQAHDDKPTACKVIARQKKVRAKRDDSSK